MMPDLVGALAAIVRSVVREELRAALVEHRQQEREREAAKLLPLPEAARKLNLTAKALRSRIERGSVPGAQRVGSRWHVPLQIAPGLLEFTHRHSAADPDVAKPDARPVGDHLRPKS